MASSDKKALRKKSLDMPGIPSKTDIVIKSEPIESEEKVSKKVEGSEEPNKTGTGSKNENKIDSKIDDNVIKKEVEESIDATDKKEEANDNESNVEDKDVDIENCSDHGSGPACNTPDPEQVDDDDVQNDHEVPRMRADQSVLAQYQKPFKFGWYREIVVRGTASEGRKKAMDVYYFTPTGRKLRSAPQIVDYVEQNPANGLSKKNFTFSKHTLYKQPFEVVRSAGGGAGRKPKTPGEKTKTLSEKTRTPSEKIKKPAVLKAVEKALAGTDKRTVKILLKPLANTDTVQVQSLANTEKKQVSILPKRSNGTPTPGSLTEEVLNALNMKPKIAPKPVQMMKTVVIYPDKKPEIKLRKITEVPTEVSSGDEEVDGESIITIHPDDIFQKKDKPYKPVKARKSFARKRPLDEDDDYVPEETSKKAKVPKICGMDCPGSEGLFPALVCSICQCLFHHACVNVNGMLTQFSCETCRNGQHEARINDPLCVPNCAETSPSFVPTTVGTARGAVPAMFNSQQLVTPYVMSNTPPRQMPTLFRCPPRLIRPNLLRPGLKLPSQLVPLSMIQTSSVATMPVVPPPQASSVEGDGKRGQLLTLPVGVMSQLKLDGPVELRINGRLITVDPDSFIATPEGSKILLPPETLDLQAGQSFNVSIPPSALRKQSPKTKDKTPDITTPPPMKICPPTVVKTPDGKPRKQPKLTKSAKPAIPVSVESKTPSKVIIRAPKPTMRSILQGYECMSKVFEYLELPDLLRASQVCKSWKSLLTNHPSLQAITLHDCSIGDWPKFGDFLLKKKTESLDLCGIELTGKFDKEWSRFKSIVPKLRYLKQVSLGQCPPNILYTVAEEIPFLESLQAENITETDREPDVWFTNATIDLGKLSTFKCLTDLRLRGMAGLKTQSSNYSRVQRLSQLKNLRKLSITSLKQVDGFELAFLETLNLDELEIGDCDTWTEETYAYLNKLSLKKLHLENCGESDKYLSSALPNWQTLKELDLIMVAVNEGLGKSLAKLTGLESLSICPDTRDTDALTNRNTLLAVRDLKHLKYFLWCAVMTPSEETDENEMEFLRQGIEDSLYFGETGLPPPERMNNNVDESKISSFDDDEFSDLDMDEEIAMMKGDDPKTKAKNDKQVSIEFEVIDHKSDSDEESVNENESENDRKEVSIDKDGKPEDASNTDEKSEKETAENTIESSKEVEDMEVDIENMDEGSEANEAMKIDDEKDSGQTESDSPKKHQTDSKPEKKVSNGSETESTSKEMKDDLKHSKASDSQKLDDSKIDSSKLDESNTKLDDSILDTSKLDESTFSDSSKPNDSTAESANPDSTAETSEKPKKARKRRKRSEVLSSDTEPRRSGRKRTLKRSDDSSIAFVTLETLIEILVFHLPETDIRVDPIGLMK